MTTSPISPAYLYLNTLDRGASRRTSRQALERAVRFFSSNADVDVESFEWHTLRYPDVVELRAELAANLAPNTGNRVLCAVKQVAIEARRLGLIAADECTLIREVKRIPGTREAPGRMIPNAELAALFAAAQEMPTRWLRRRNAALLAILFGGGLRRTEVATLRLHDVEEIDGQFELRVMGKNNRQRVIPLPAAVTPVISQWLSERGSKGEWLFPSRRDFIRKQMSDQNVYKLIRRFSLIAGLGMVTPHDARRTFISRLLEEGVDICIVAGLVGHTKLETTRMYDRRGRKAQKNAVNRLTFDFPMGESLVVAIPSTASVELPSSNPASDKHLAMNECRRMSSRHRLAHHGT